MSIIQEIFNIVAPYECIGCQKEGSLLCYDCGSTLTTVPPRCYRCGRWSDGFRTCQNCRRYSPIHSLWAAAKYEGVAKELLHRLKFERAQAVAQPVAERLATLCTGEPDFLVTYVPTAATRARQRGYDQSALIAKELSRRLGCPFLPCLARSGQQRQVGSRREVRAKQMVDVFRPTRERLFKGRHVLLVDDVLTTGATCEAAARALRQTGARRVSVAVFAVA